MIPEKYRGKICPFCKTEFRDGDDIVVCSICDMPHHKECWIENKGCTTFGCQGTIKSPDFSQPAENSPASGDRIEIEFPEARKVFCPRCGAENRAVNRFCGSCGNPLRQEAPGCGEREPIRGYGEASHLYSGQTQPYAVPWQENKSSPYSDGASAWQNSSGWQPGHAGTDEKEQAAFIGKNSDYYMRKFKSMQTRNSSASWNFCAFFFATSWFFYRRMYGWAFGITGIMLVLNLLGDLGSVVQYGVYIAAGILGNYLYMQHVRKKIGECSSMSEPYRTMEIVKKGGVSVPAVICQLVVLFLLELVLLSSM